MSLQKILKNLYENTALHEKIAENINKGLLGNQGKVVARDNEPASSRLSSSNTIGGDMVVGAEGKAKLGSETSSNAGGEAALIRELDHIVTGIITETTADPAFENLLEEVFGKELSVCGFN